LVPELPSDKKLNSSKPSTRENARARLALRGGLLSTLKIEPSTNLRYCKAHCKASDEGPVKGDLLGYSNDPVYNDPSHPWRNNANIERNPSAFPIPPDPARAPATESRAQRHGQHNSRKRLRDATGGSLDTKHGAAASVDALVQENERLKALLAKAKKKVAKTKQEMALKIDMLSYNALSSGPLSAACRQWTNLDLGGLEVLVQGMKLCGLEQSYLETMSSRSYKAETKAFGFENAMTLVLVRCALGLTESNLAHLFKLSDRRVVGEIFKPALLAGCFWMEQILAAVPDLAQLQEDALPAFRNNTFRDALFTMDATNTNIQSPSTPRGRRESYSDYYASCCGKWEVITAPDGTPMWVSYAFGGRASEVGIMRGSDWNDFFTKCADAWETELDGRPIKVLADKGTRMRQDVEKAGGVYMCPSTLVNNTVSLKDAKKNELISKARGHVERAIGRVKRNKILQGKMPWTLVPLLDDILFFCVFATHLVAPVKGEVAEAEESWDADEIFAEE